MISGPCRFCQKPLSTLFCDLGMSPLSNDFLKPDQIQQKESFYPLKVYFCDSCFLVQLHEFESPEHIFSDYAYCSSYSDTWLKHCQRYVDDAQKRFSLGVTSFVIEVASNDGYLLQFFKKKGIQVLGVEPAANIARIAEAAGIPTRVKFFGTRTAQDLVSAEGQSDLLIGNNVLAHVPDLNDFVEGLWLLLKPSGVITMEFPHVMRLMQDYQFDTIYHEHFSYFSFTTVQKVFATHGLELFDVDELPTHGGSLRIYAQHGSSKAHQRSKAVDDLLVREKALGLTTRKSYLSFNEQVKKAKRKLLSFLIQAKEQGQTIVGYGAPAKGNTLLNYCGIGTDFLDYTVDRSPQKQGRFLPGTHIPIFPVEKIRETRPDLVLILPWNLRDEIMSQMDYVREWGGKFVVPIPSVCTVP